MPDRLLEHLSERLTALQRGLTDEDQRWMRLVEVLGCLYRLEESERRTDQTYYGHRDARADGRTLGGLIWARGLVDHHEAELRALVLAPVTVHAATDGRWAEVKTFVAQEGGLVEATVWTGAHGWPARSDLPEGPRERRGRDAMYDQHVAGQSLMRPLEAAAGYMHERRARS